MSLTKILVSAVLVGFSFVAQASHQDITSQIASLRCEIPSDDQQGIAELFINEKSGYRSLVLALEYAEFAKWKMVTFPIDQVTSDDTDGTITMRVQYKGGYEGSVLIRKDMSGIVTLKTPATTRTIPMSHCQLK